MTRWNEAQNSEYNFWNIPNIFEFEDKNAEIQYKELLENIQKKLNISENTNILDLGCGPTCVSKYITIGKHYGLDPLMDFYKQKFLLPKDFILMTSQGETLPFTDNYMDVVVCINVLDHVQNPTTIIQEIKRVLKPKGYAIIIVHTYSKFICDIYNYFEKKNVFLKEKEHPYHFSIESIIDLFKSNNLSLKEQINIENIKHIYKPSKNFLFQRLYNRIFTEHRLIETIQLIINLLIRKMLFLVNSIKGNKDMENICFIVCKD